MILSLRGKKMKNRIFRFGLVTILAALFISMWMTAVPQPSSAGSLSTAVIGMFPKDVGEFAYADMKTARKFSWFPQIREQLLPSRFRQFEQFLSSAGIDPNTQVDEMAWAGITTQKGNGEEIVGVALGSFDTGSAEARFKAQKLPTFDVRGYHLYAFGSGLAANDILFTFIDNNTAAFGHRQAIEELIGVRMGDTQGLMSNSQLFPLINETNGSGFIWAVLNQSYTHLAMQQLMPQTSQFPQAAQIVQRMQAMTISVQGDSGIDADFQAVCATPDDANVLAAALQAGILYRRYQEAQGNPALATALDQVRVSPSGDRLKIDAPLTQDQIASLIQSKVFVVKM
jgi:hypothetical protein